jgi:DNA-binding CsgD family transcriptional regulator
MKETAKRYAHAAEAFVARRAREPMLPRLRRRSKPFLAQRFVIREIPTGEVRLCVPAENNGEMSVERVAGVLAMHCLVLKKPLEDFEVLAVPQTSLISKVAERAKRLINAGDSINVNERLSQLDQAILDGVVQNLRNKEIAAKVNVSVHTVRAHVSSLLAKFKVSNRTELGRQLWSPSFR